MHSDDRNGDGPESVDDPGVDARRKALDARLALIADQTAADADQTLADAEQTRSDADEAAADADQTSADRDQLASDHDQATATHDHDARADLTAADEAAFEIAREERRTGSIERLVNRFMRAGTSKDRDLAATQRDRTGDERDSAGLARDARAAGIASATTESEAALIHQLEELAAKAAADRARAAADRERAANDRAEAARERSRLEAELRSAHLDDLTGAYRRELGRMALSHEIDRARRSDGRFVLAFVDVDELKAINDREGHAAGDRVLQTVVRVIRTRLRSFDPIIRYGGDEFVCGLGGTDLAEAERRFDSIGIAIEGDARVAISVGLASLATGETVDQLTERADAAMLQVKARHHARQ